LFVARPLGSLLGLSALAPPGHYEAHATAASCPLTRDPAPYCASSTPTPSSGGTTLSFW
jgi:hypothetical protein